MRTSLAVVVRALRKNGYKQAFGTFVEKKNGKVVAACALGQAALNLKVSPQDLQSALTRFVSSDGHNLGETIVHWNDENRWTLDQIADRIEKDWTDTLSQKVVV